MGRDQVGGGFCYLTRSPCGGRHNPCHSLLPKSLAPERPWQNVWMSGSWYPSKTECLLRSTWNNCSKGIFTKERSKGENPVASLFLFWRPRGRREQPVKWNWNYHLPGAILGSWLLWWTSWTLGVNLNAILSSHHQNPLIKTVGICSDHAYL